MNKKICAIIVFVIPLLLILCGCQEQPETKNNNINENVELEAESNIVELVYADLIPNIDNGNIVSVDVEYLFKNIAGRRINFNVTAEFYDAEDNLLYTGGPKTFEGIIENYTETIVAPGINSISYTDVNASKVDHVKLVVKEF